MPDFSKIRKQIEQLKTKGLEFFAAIDHLEGPLENYEYGQADKYWSKLDETQRQDSANLQTEVIEIVRPLANCIKQSTLLTEADRRDLGTWTKSLRASLHLTSYSSWDAELLHDEGVVYGIQQAGQSEADPAHPCTARNRFERDIVNLTRFVDLLDISPNLSTDEFSSNPQATAEYEPDSAFVMMQIDPQIPSLEDRYNTIKECFAQFGIEAVRADDIQHEDVITKKITEKIESSEFLIADLTGERPSVYYEVGYAHSLKRKVILYRFKDTRLHFDLAAYNCPEYSNLTDLKQKLMRRLEQITNRKPSK